MYLSFLLLNSTRPYIFNSWKHPNFLCQLASSRCWRAFCCSALSHVQLFVTACTAAHQAFPSLTVSQSLLQFRPAELVMPSNHLVICHLLFPAAVNLVQHRCLFQWVGSSILYFNPLIKHYYYYFTSQCLCRIIYISVFFFPH